MGRIKNSKSLRTADCNGGGGGVLVDALRSLLVQSRVRSFCVALSGGMDSSALLAAAGELRAGGGGGDCTAAGGGDGWEISACHINHGLSGRAAQWENFCRAQCAAAAIPLSVHRATPPPNGGGEEWARAARLRAFAAARAEAVVLAHHADDQAETVLFRLLRGAGVHGLAAMRPQTVLHGKTILRPWLDIRRAALLDFARRARLRWIEDEDNRNEQRRRNFLRRRVFPVLGADGAAPLAAAAKRLDDAANLLAELAAADGRDAMRAAADGGALTDGGYSAAHFRNLGEARLRNWLYAELQKRRQPASERYVAEAARQIICAAGAAGELRFNFRDVALRKWRDGLYWDSFCARRPESFFIEVSPVAAVLPLQELGGELILTEQTGGGLSPARLDGGLSARLRRGGEKMPLCGRPTRAVADLMREADIAPWRRRRLPLLFARGKLAAVPGVAVSAEFAAQDGEAGLHCGFRWYG